MITWTNETRKLRDLIPWDPNPREINKAEAERLGDSLAEFGQIQTIAIGPDDEIYDGHQRKAVWALLPQFGPDYEVDVRVSSRALTERERQKLVVYLHRGTVGQWDWDALANAFDVPDLLEWGFEERDLQLDWGSDATPDPGAQVDKAAELQEKWQVQRGQIWQVGRHRIMCGDSTCAEDVERLMGNEGAQAVVTDPPYAFGLSSVYSLGTKSGGWHDMMNNASWFMDRFDQWRELIEVGPLWVFCNWRTLPIMMRAACDSGVGINSVLVWYKDWIGPGGPLGLRPTYELVCLSSIGGYAIPNRGVEDFVTVKWSSHKPNEHLSEKPVELMAHIVRVSECPINFDPFVGVGSTLVGCEQVGRIGYGMEIEPKYVAVTLERLTQMGLDAHLVS